LPEKRLGVGLAVRRENNFGKIVLNPSELIFDIMRCTEENGIGIVKTRNDESLSNK